MSNEIAVRKIDTRIADLVERLLGLRDVSQPSLMTAHERALLKQSMLKTLANLVVARRTLDTTETVLGGGLGSVTWH